jgi:4-aminobutyrate aminotransferase-like enzyme
VSSLLIELRKLMEHNSCIGDVRGSGFFIGVELVTNRETLEPATELADKVVNEMRERAILLGTDGPFNNVIKIRPPMPFSSEDAAELVMNLDQILQGLSRP